MAFEDPAEEELDYDNDDALDPGLPGHPVLEDEELDDDEDYEDLYGDVNVGMYAALPPTSGNVGAPNGDLDMDSVNEDENGAEEDLKAESVEPRDAGVMPRPPQEESVEYDYLPDVKEETLYGDPSKPKDVSDQGPTKASAPKGGKTVGGANGTDGGAGRGWPAGSGPAGRGLLHSCYPFRTFSCLVYVVCYLNFWSAALCMLEQDLGFPYSVGIFLHSVVPRFCSMAWNRAGEGGRQSWRSNLCKVLPYSAIEVWYFPTYSAFLFCVSRTRVS